MGTSYFDCPLETKGMNRQKKDESLKVIYNNFDQKDILIRMKMLGITVSALLIIGLTVTAVGKIGYEI